jgi:hypothetical protein
MASKNTPDLIVSGAGWLMQFGSKVSKGLIASGFTAEDIHRLATQQGEEEMSRGIAAFVSAIAGPPVPSYDPATGLYRWLVNYDETIAEKLKNLDPATIGWATDYATDEKFPENRTGTKIVTGRIYHPNKVMRQNAVEQEAKGTLAFPKELIDFLRAFPRPMLDGDLPLAAAGQFWSSPHGNRYYLYAHRFGEERYLNYVWLSPSEEWSGYWRFLVLE